MRILLLICISVIGSGFMIPFSDTTIKIEDESLIIDGFQSTNAKRAIPDPLKIEYEYSKVVKLEDGSSGNLFIEKGKKNNIGGNYAWSKVVPIYASNEIKYSFEYQMDFTIDDVVELSKWLDFNIGRNVKVGSIDSPSWYKNDMTLGDIYRYCANNHKNITMGYYNESLKRTALVIIDSGSEITNTRSEIGLVYLIYNTK